MVKEYESKNKRLGITFLFYLLDLLFKVLYNISVKEVGNMAKPKGDNKFHLHIQMKYRTLIQENKKKPDRAKRKRENKKLIESF